MVNLTELEKKIEELQAEVKKLKNSELDANGMWVPEEGERYYSINNYDHGSTCYWDEEDDDNFHYRRLKQGLVFRTKKERDYHLKMEDKAFKIRKAGREEFKEDEDNWHVYASTTNRVVTLSRTRLRHDRRVYFDTEKQCKTAFGGLPYKDVSYMISKGLI